MNLVWIVAATVLSWIALSFPIAVVLCRCLVRGRVAIEPAAPPGEPYVVAAPAPARPVLSRG